MHQMSELDVRNMSDARFSSQLEEEQIARVAAALG